MKCCRIVFAGKSARAKTGSAGKVAGKKKSLPVAEATTVSSATAVGVGAPATTTSSDDVATAITTSQKTATSSSLTFPQSTTRFQLPVLIDGNAFSHRWYHRWAFMQKSLSRQTADAESQALIASEMGVDGQGGGKGDGALQINPQRFAVNNARALIALAQSFCVEHVVSGKMPMVTPKFFELPKKRLNGLVVCFDQGDAGRSLVYPAYKGERRAKPREPELQIFLDEAKSVYRGEGARSLLLLPEGLSDPAGAQRVNAEADDMLSTISLELRGRGIPHIVMTHDIDLMHLVTDCPDAPVAVYDPRKKSLLKEKDVFERVGVFPKDIVDFKALQGDKSDSIPGVTGVGEKRAVELLRLFGGLDEILRRGPLEAHPKRVRTLLSEGRESAEMSKRLVQHVHCESILEDTRRFLDIRIKKTH